MRCKVCAFLKWDGGKSAETVDSVRQSFWAHFAKIDLERFKIFEKLRAGLRKMHFLRQLLDDRKISLQTLTKHSVRG